MQNLRNIKAQMEIMGLAIIFILIALGVLFAVSFVINDSSTVKIARESTLANNFVDALLKTTTECKSLTINQLLDDCNRGETIRCPSQRKTCTEYVEASKVIIERTLASWGRDYQLMFLDAQKDIVSNLSIISKNCTLVESSKTYSAGTGSLALRLCED